MTVNPNSPCLHKGGRALDKKSSGNNLFSLAVCLYVCVCASYNPQCSRVYICGRALWTQNHSLHVTDGWPYAQYTPSCTWKSFTCTGTCVLREREREHVSWPTITAPLKAEQRACNAVWNSTYWFISFLHGGRVSESEAWGVMSVSQFVTRTFGTVLVPCRVPFLLLFFLFKAGTGEI